MQDSKKKWEPTDEERAHYLKLMHTIRRSANDIARMCGISGTTVRDVLNNDRKHFASAETVRRIFAKIDSEATALGEAINRLSGHNLN